MIFKHTIETNPNGPNKNSVQQNNWRRSADTRSRLAINISYQAWLSLVVDIPYQTLTPAI